MYDYLVYGLRLRSGIPISGLEPLLTPHVEVDCEVHTEEIPPVGAITLTTDSADADDPVTIHRGEGDPADHLLVYRDGTRFLLRDHGRQIWTSWTEESTPQDMATYLLGPVLAFVLRLGGTLSLHGSAVVIDGFAIAIVGPSGAGKSTTASAFADRGVPVMSDDVVPIVWRQQVPAVFGGYPRIRLWPDAAEALYGSADALPLLTPTWQKRFVDLRSGRCFDPGPHRLGGVVLLGERTDGPPRLEMLDAPDAAMQLIANTSMALHIDREVRRDELEQIVDLVSVVPVARLHASHDISRIGEACGLVPRLLELTAAGTGT